jgi:septal ring factor EnvC (AmiA/AmiB activator)
LHAWRLRLILAASLLAGVALQTATAADTKEAAAHPADTKEDRAGHDLEDLRRRIRDAQRDVTATEESRSEAADALRKSEQAISEATRTLRELGQQESDAQSVLARLEVAQSASREAISAGQLRLAALLRHQYSAGGNDTLNLLLSGEDPARAARDAEYLHQLARARQAAVAVLRRDLARLAELNQEAQAKADELARTREARARERLRLQKESSARARMVSDLSTRLQAQKRNLQTLERDERRLTQLVERITKALEERRVQREKALRERLQREKAARAAARERKGGDSKAEGEAAGTESGGAEGGKAGGEVHKPPEIVARIEESAEEGYDTEAFPRMKGHLRLPVTGELANRYGSPREDSGLNWKGLFIRAPQGREVHAVGSGRVVYSDWLRGFGNLLIIDHGSGYMSLYGNNESLYARVGDVVKGGVAVASVGNSGGNAEPGLYFEIRYQSRPFDPMTWVERP